MRKVTEHVVGKPDVTRYEAHDLSLFSTEEKCLKHEAVIAVAAIAEPIRRRKAALPFIGGFARGEW